MRKLVDMVTSPWTIMAFALFIMMGLVCGSARGVGDKIDALLETLTDEAVDRRLETAHKLGEDFNRRHESFMARCAELDKKIEEQSRMINLLTNGVLCLPLTGKEIEDAEKWPPLW